MVGFRGNSQRAMHVFVYVSVVFIKIGGSHMHKSHPTTLLRIEYHVNPNIGSSSVASVCMGVCSWVGG